MENSDSFNVGDIYCQKESKAGKYYMFQIIGKKEDKQLTYLLLDYFKEHKPDERDLIGIKPPIRERWFWNNSMNYSHASMKKFPIDAEFIGNVSPLITDVCHSYGSWPNGYDFIGEQEWFGFPSTVRQQFKEGCLDQSEIVVADIPMKRSMGIIDDKLLSEMKNYVGELYELPAAYNFRATKFYPQLIPFLETRHTAHELNWSNHGQQVLDLSRTYLANVVIDDENMHLIRLPKSCTSLALRGKLSPDLKIESVGQGESLTIQVDIKEQNGIIPDFGCINLNKLILTSVENLDLKKIP